MSSLKENATVAFRKKWEHAEQDVERFKATVNEERNDSIRLAIEWGESPIASEEFLGVTRDWEETVEMVIAETEMLPDACDALVEEAEKRIAKLEEDFEYGTPWDTQSTSLIRVAMGRARMRGRVEAIRAYRSAIRQITSFVRKDG